MEIRDKYDDFMAYADPFLNATTDFPTTATMNTTDSSVKVMGVRSFGSHALKAVYVLGVVFNALAMVALRRGERRVRNRKHLLLLTALAANDLVALAGMLCAMVVSERAPWLRGTRPYCAARVVLRVFGIGSVCIAVTMALERYLALTRPFLYQKEARGMEQTTKVLLLCKAQARAHPQPVPNGRPAGLVGFMYRCSVFLLYRLVYGECTQRIIQR
ncbi:hypothetical protein EVAR_46654_1 [Eumeta japonica]|uniref:G-protein coupled receptors family 1 profile domain-containing protein n=1 Tax=Eumeta variegata TaxID=151549 RepID=A0A4C1Y6H4_EUMVA|nr:hypothetical protein EVAR_46654_1 [Eumeta japonica]